MRSPRSVESGAKPLLDLVWYFLPRDDRYEAGVTHTHAKPFPRTYFDLDVQQIELLENLESFDALGGRMPLYV